jgi:acyl-CoA thioester hydrolase
MTINPFPVQIRFSDIDLLGHVNNVAYFNFFEMARIHYFHPLLGPDWDWFSKGVVLVNNEATYLHSILLHDKPIIILKVTEIGTKSFTLGYEVFVGEQLCATGASKLVCFNNHLKASIEIPDKMMIALKSLLC